MTRDELIAAVPVHEQDGRPNHVDLADIPQPWRDQFWTALYGSQCPKIEGIERAAYAWDWKSWVTDSWYGGRNGPTGLDAEPTNMHALHRLADYPVLAGTSTRQHCPGSTGKPCRQANGFSCARSGSR